METNLDARRDREEVAVVVGAGEETLLGLCPAQARDSAAYIALGPADAGSTVGPSRRPASPKISWAVSRPKNPSPSARSHGYDHFFDRQEWGEAASESQLYSGS